jgi:hypothetical protein
VPLPESVRAHRVEGRLEAVVDGRAVGWAWSPERPEDTLDVEVLVDGEVVARGAADVERPALLEAGIGHGRYGFDIQLPERLGGAGAHSIQVVAGPEREGLSPLAGFETTVRRPEAPWVGTRFTPGATAPIPAFEDEPPPSSGEAALIGRRGWLFAWDGATIGLEQLTGAPLLDEEGVRRWREQVADRHRRLRDLRIPYVFAVAPAKERVYGKFLPEGLRLDPRQPARELNAALRDLNGGEVVDLLPAILTARPSGRLFPLTGSEWSDRGAFFAYRRLMKEAGKCLIDLGEPLLPEEGRFVRRQGFRGDLAEKPKLSFEEGRLSPLEEDDGRWQEQIEVADVAALRSLRMPAPEHLEVTPGHAPRLYEIADAPELPRAVLVGDAPCLALIPWLAEHFRRFVYLPAAEPPLEAIELEAPDVVIHVVSERLLASAP